MKWWLYRSRLWAVIIGTLTAFGLALGQGMDASGPPKVGDVITLKFRDAPDRQFKVLKVDKQADGSYLSEVKDIKTGETITLFDRANDAPVPQRPVAQPMVPKAQQPATPKLNLPYDPLFPPLAPPPNQPANPNPSPPGYLSAKPNANAGVATMPDQPQDPPKKPSLFARIFGPKKPNPPAKTNPQNPPAPTAVNSAPTTMSPPSVPVPGLFPPATTGTAEPPRVLPMQPVLPPLFPNATLPPVAPAPPPQLPLPPAPMIPGLPSIPIPPQGLSKNTWPIIQARYASPATAALLQDIEPFIVAMRTGHAPSDRICGLQALAGCRHASTDTVKSLLFHTCTSDPCPLVRACCIDELCKLGYYDPVFLAYLHSSQEDPSPDVKDAARNALKKLSPQHQTMEK